MSEDPKPRGWYPPRADYPIDAAALCLAPRTLMTIAEVEEFAEALAEGGVADRFDATSAEEFCVFAPVAESDEEREGC